jgi:hypothetical protein
LQIIIKIGAGFKKRISPLPLRRIPLKGEQFRDVSKFSMPSRILPPFRGAGGQKIKGK